MNASRREFLNHVFVLDEDELRKLYDALCEFSPCGKITIQCADKIQRRLDNLEELLAFENSPTKEIVALTIAGRTEDYDRSVSVDFQNERGSNVTLSIEGPEEALITLSSAIEDRLFSMRPWYAFLAKREPFNVTAAVVGAFFLSLIVFVAFNVLSGRWKFDNANATDPKATILGPLSTVIIFLIAWLIWFILRRTQRALFPMDVFATGQGKKRYAKLEWLRTSVVVAFCISLAAGVVLFFVTLVFR